MSYIEGFYKEVGAKTDFQKIVAANLFEAVTVQDFCNAEYTFMNVIKDLDFDDVEFDYDKVCDYILADDILYKEIDFLGRAFEDYGRVTGDGILGLSDKEVKIKVLKYLKAHRLPDEVLELPVQVSDEQWSNIMDEIIEFEQRDIEDME